MSDVIPRRFTKMLSTWSELVNSSATTYKSGLTLRAQSSMYSATCRSDASILAAAEEKEAQQKTQGRTHVQRRRVTVVETQSVENFGCELDVLAHVSPQEWAVLWLVSVSAWIRRKFIQK